MRLRFLPLVGALLSLLIAVPSTYAISAGNRCNEVSGSNKVRCLRLQEQNIVCAGLKNFARRECMDKQRSGMVSENRPGKPQNIERITKRAIRREFEAISKPRSRN